MSLKDFQFLGKLGQGAYSSVYKVKRLIDNEIYAIKKVKMNNLTDRQKQNALNQVRILASINCPNVIAYKQAFIDKSTNFLYIVMEFADEGDLYAKITKHTKQNTTFEETEIWSILIQVTRGLKALHQLRILHRDIKSANVFLFSDGSIKLGDMNVSKLATKNMLKTQTGTPYYASPEVWKDQPYDKKSDIWSLGCVLYQSIALKPPFRANDMEGLFKKVTRGFYSRIPPEYSDQLNNIVKMLLQVTTHLRPTCDKLLQLPVVIKHIQQALPQEVHDIKQQKRINPKNFLLKTIKLSGDSKGNIDLEMPRARYASMLEPSSPGLSPVFQQSFQKGFPKADIQKFPRLGQQSPHGVVKWNQKSQMVKLLTDNSQSDMQKISKSLNIAKANREKGKYAYESLEGGSGQQRVKHRRKQSVQIKQKTRQKLPLIHQGRLKSMSPETLKLLIMRQKQKKRVYSIIDKKF